MLLPFWKSTMIEPSAGMPIWVGIITLILSGGVGAGILKLIETWGTNRAARDINASSVRLNDVGALNQAIVGLSGENSRMAKRLNELENKISVLQNALDERDKRIDDLEDEVEEQRRRRHELERHLAIAEKRIDALAKEMHSNGLDPGSIIGVPF